MVSDSCRKVEREVVEADKECWKPSALDSVCRTFELPSELADRSFIHLSFLKWTFYCLCRPNFLLKKVVAYLERPQELIKLGLSHEGYRNKTKSEGNIDKGLLIPVVFLFSFILFHNN